jgi:hypothetical protein
MRKEDMLLLFGLSTIFAIVCTVIILSPNNIVGEEEVLECVLTEESLKSFYLCSEWNEWQCVDKDSVWLGCDIKNKQCFNYSITKK